jgi:hypothetical protein
VVIKNLLIIVCLVSTIHASAQQNSLEQDFKNPPLVYRPIPFWHLNGKLTTEGINKQVADAGKYGFGGVAVLPVTPGPQYPTNIPAPGMSPAYLSGEYFLRYADILNAAKKDGLHVILYDDIDFPSGTAGGKLKQLYPEAVRKNLVRKDTIVIGPQALKMPLPKGQTMAAVGWKDSIANRKDLTSFAHDGQFEWQVPGGKWQIELYTCETDNDDVVDYMDEQAVKKFVSLTYDEYYRHFPRFFGNVIRQTFYDDVGYVTKERGWTGKFNDKFTRLFKKNPAIYYPALWEDIGPETEAARVALFDTRAELLSEGFPKVIAAWDNRHGIKSSGHPPGNYEIQPVDMNFDIFKFYRHEDIPTMDAIFYHGHGREGYKLVSSAAAVYDRPIVASETFGAFLESGFDVNTLYRTSMEIFVRGINQLIPHGMWYDPDPKSVRIPPLVSPYSTKIGPALKRFNDYAARTSMMLQGGRTVAEIGIIYPIASLEGFYHFQSKDYSGFGKYAPPGTDYLKMSDMLTNQIHRDFTFIHPELFTGNKYLLKGNELILNNKINIQNYKLIIIPAGKVISYKTLQKIKLYYGNGGKIIATGVLPAKSAEFGHDEDVKHLVTEIFGNGANENHNANGGIASFIPDLTQDKLQQTIDKLLPLPDVIMENNPQPASGNGMFSYLHKIKDNKSVYYFANSSDDRIDTYLDLKGKLHPQLWNVTDGNIVNITDVRLVKIKGHIYTRFKFSLPAVQSVFIVSKL